MKKKTKIVGLFLMITLLFFAIPGFGKVQASREDDVFDGWQELEDEAKKEEEIAHYGEDHCLRPAPRDGPAPGH